MYKTMIIQKRGDREIGRTVLVEDFETLRAAKLAGKRYKPTEESWIQVNFYEDSKKNHLISFDEQDTGEIVFVEKNP